MRRSTHPCRPAVARRPRSRASAARHRRIRDRHDHLRTPISPVAASEETAASTGPPQGTKTRPTLAPSTSPGASASARRRVSTCSGRSTRWANGRKISSPRRRAAARLRCSERVCGRSSASRIGAREREQRKAADNAGHDGVRAQAGARRCATGEQKWQNREHARRDRRDQTGQEGDPEQDEHVQSVRAPGLRPP